MEELIIWNKSALQAKLMMPLIGFAYHKDEMMRFGKGDENMLDQFRTNFSF